MKEIIKIKHLIEKEKLEDAYEIFIELLNTYSCECEFISRREDWNHIINIVGKTKNKTKLHSFFLAISYYYLYVDSRPHKIFCTIPSDSKDGIITFFRNLVNENDISEPIKLARLIPIYEKYELNYFAFRIATIHEKFADKNEKAIKQNEMRLKFRRSKGFLEKSIILCKKLEEEYRNKAVHYYSEIIKSGNDIYCSLKNRALQNFKLNNIAEAISDTNKCIELQPSKSSGYLIQSIIYDNIKEEKKAIDVLTKGIKESKNSELIVNRGELYFKINQFTKAIEDFENYLAKDRPWIDYRDYIIKCRNLISDSYFNLAIEGENKGDIDKAIEILLKGKKYYNFKTEYYLNLILKKQNRNIPKKSDKEYIDIRKNLKSVIEKKEFLKEDVPEKESHIDSLRIYDKHTVLNFGKFKDKSIEEIIDLEPPYILWCIINLHHFIIEETVFLLLESKKLSRYLDSVISNRYKLMLMKEKEDIVDELYNHYEGDIYYEKDTIDYKARAEEANRELGRDMDSMNNPGNTWHDDL